VYFFDRFYIYGINRPPTPQTFPHVFQGTKNPQNSGHFQLADPVSTTSV